MDQLLGDAKRLVQRLGNHDNSVDILISEATNLQNKLIAMRQYRDEVSKLNDIADHRPRSTLILGSQLENQRIQNLEQENRELSISLAEHQSALELIMNKYREQVLLMMEPKSFEINVTKNTDQSIEMDFLKERIAEMAHVMWESAAIDDNAQIKEIEFVRQLQVENENLRELLQISGGNVPSGSSRQISYISPEMQSSSEKNARLDSYMLPETDSSVKTENISSNLSSLHINEDLKDRDEVDMLHSFPMDKLKKRYGLKKEQIFENMPLSFELDGIETNSSSKTKSSDSEHIQNLKRLFNDPGTSSNDKRSTDTLPQLNDSLPLLSDTSSNSNSEKYFMSLDPSENCFRAIISDIKPLDFNVDMNDKLYDHESTSDTRQQSDNTSLFFSDTPPPLSENDDDSSDMSETSVIEYLDFIVEPPPEDDDVFSYHDQQSDTDLIVDGEMSSERSDEHEVADISSVTSGIHEASSNDEIKDHFKASLRGSNGNETPSQKELRVNFATPLQNSKEDEVPSNDENRGHFETSSHSSSENEAPTDDENRGHFGTSSHSSTEHDAPSNEENRGHFETSSHNSNENETSCNDDDRLSFETSSHSSNENEASEASTDDENRGHFEASLQSTTENDEGELDALGFLDDILDSEDGFDEMNESDNNFNEQTRIICPNHEDSTEDSTEVEIDFNINYNSTIELKTKLTVNNDNDITLSSDDDERTPNGDVSDNDSEITYTEEDIDQALSDFDSFLDFNDNDEDDDEYGNNDSE